VVSSPQVSQQKPVYASSLPFGIGRLGADNAFPPGQVLNEYSRAEEMGDVTGVLSCTAVDKKQQN
jgi:hypothetical protein